MRHPWANVALLTLLVAQFATGFEGLIRGAESSRWILWLHGIGGFAIVLLLRWKGAIILHAWRRDARIEPARLGFLTLAVLLLAALATGLVWTFAGRILLDAYSLITSHVVLAVAVLLLLGWHVFWMRFIFGVRGAAGRRTLLRVAGLSLAGLALWRSSALAMAVLDLPGRRRRFTGSYETGSYTGAFPVVTWLFDYPPPVDVRAWRLTVEGAVERPFSLTYEELGRLPAEVLGATVDCTGGWYSTQGWEGVAVARLLDLAGPEPDARSVTFEAVSGYGRRYPLAESRRLLLATRVAGRSLDHGHGFPLRLVAPDYRGFDWVKWVTRVRVEETSHLLQPPVPLQ